MDLVPKKDVLEIGLDTVTYVRTKYGLNESGRMTEAVNILDQWVRQQPHFKKKDFPKQYLESFIIGSKGSIERAKLRLDKLCTLRTLIPHFFGQINVKHDIGNLLEYIVPILMPKITADHYRIYVIKVYNDQFTATDFFNYFRYSVSLAEYVKLHDYMDGFIVIMDLSEVSVMECLNRLDLIITRQALPIFLDCYTIRLKSIRIITESKLVSGLVALIRKILGSKLGSRVFANKSISEVYDIVDKKLLPKDYGGKEMSIRELKDAWVNALSSEEHVKHLANITLAATDETLRQKDKFKEEYAGMPGTFRFLDVD